MLDLEAIEESWAAACSGYENEPRWIEQGRFAVENAPALIAEVKRLRAERERRQPKDVEDGPWLAYWNLSEGAEWGNVTKSGGKWFSGWSTEEVEWVSEPDLVFHMPELPAVEGKS